MVGFWPADCLANVPISHIHHLLSVKRLITSPEAFCNSLHYVLRCIQTFIKFNRDEKNNGLLTGRPSSYHIKTKSWYGMVPPPYVIFIARNYWKWPEIIRDRPNHSLFASRPFASLPPPYKNISPKTKAQMWETYGAMCFHQTKTRVGRSRSPLNCGYVQYCGRSLGEWSLNACHCLLALHPTRTIRWTNNNVLHSHIYNSCLFNTFPISVEFGWHKYKFISRIKNIIFTIFMWYIFQFGKFKKSYIIITFI